MRQEREPALVGFPKVREPLPPAYAALYKEHYKRNRDGRSSATAIAQWLERWMHRAVARDVTAAGRGGATLEIGAGTLNHLPFEPATAPYDVVEPFAALLESSNHRARVRNFYSDIRDVPLEACYERVISIATFEHVCDLPFVVARAGLLLEPGGTLRIGIPSEGEPGWRLAWTLGTGIEFRLRHRLPYGVLMRHEHVNTAREIRRVVGHFFHRVRVEYFGPAMPLSLYQFLECTRPLAGRCLAVAG